MSQKSRMCGCHRQSRCQSVIWAAFVILSYCLVTASTVSAVSAPALFVFGDSLVDPGNNNGRILSLAKCNYPPYGRDFKDHKATGRFCNGKIPNDFLAQKLGIKEFLPAYLDPNLGIEDLETGVSFGSGGSGFDPLTSKATTAISQTDQLILFKESTAKLTAAIGEERTSAIVSNSIYMVAAGSNDIINNYYFTGVRHLEYNSIEAYIDFVIDQAGQFFRDLYNLGARRILIMGLPPLGCLPSQRTKAGGLLRKCVQEYNNASLEYNSKLQAKLQSLRVELLGAKLVYGDLYNPWLDLTENPSRSGFLDGDKGCCATGNIEVLYLCTVGDLASCKDATKYVYWDSFHPTETAYELIVDSLFNSASFNTI